MPYNRQPHFDFDNDSVTLMTDGELTAEGIVYGIGHEIRQAAQAADREKYTGQHIWAEDRLPLNFEQSEALGQVALQEIAEIQATVEEAGFDRHQWQHVADGIEE